MPFEGALLLQVSNSKGFATLTESKQVLTLVGTCLIVCVAQLVEQPFCKR